LGVQSPNGLFVFLSFWVDGRNLILPGLLVLQLKKYKVSVQWDTRLTLR
jgi:hypothetical protein